MYFAAGALLAGLLHPVPDMTPRHARVIMTDADFRRRVCKLYEMRIGIRT